MRSSPNEARPSSDGASLRDAERSPGASSEDEAAEESVRPTVSIVPPAPSSRRRSRLGRTIRFLLLAALFVAASFLPAAAIGLRHPELTRGILSPLSRWVPTRLVGAVESMAGAKNGDGGLDGKTADGKPVDGKSGDTSGSGRADAHLNRAGRNTIWGGVMAVPPEFSSDDGAYDLLVFFHGNTDMVEESVARAHLNAVVVIVNLGVGSGRYEERYASPIAMRDTLTRVDAAMKERGLEHPHLRRLGLGAWSAGYGAVIKIIQEPEFAEQIDSVILLDGLHVGFAEGSFRKPDELMLAPILKYADRAARGERLFVVTHSRIDPVDYASVEQTCDAILGHLGIERVEVHGTTELPPLQSIVGALPKDKLRSLIPRTEARKGNLIIRGYAGNEPEEHMAHLMQMSDTALPFLVDRWKK